MFQRIIDFIRTLYGKEGFVPLHEPKFHGNEKKYLEDCVNSTFVSSVGRYVNQFEEDVAKFTGAKFAVATVNGTAALHVSLLLAGVEPNDEVITQPLTFVATCNAISYIGAHPVFVDVDKDTLGLSPEKLEHFLSNNTIPVNGNCQNKHSKRIIKAIVPMHTFGLPGRISELQEICSKYNLALIEDAAESLGSYCNGKHTGTVGLMGILSFNGNKTITTGGGGMILTNDKNLAKKAKHVTTTAKIPHKWEFDHNQVGFNYRMPNINAALGCAQLERLPEMLANKRNTSKQYKEFFDGLGLPFLQERKRCISNYWLNAIVLDNLSQRNEFLEITNEQGVMTRPIWKLMTNLEMFQNAQMGNLENSIWLEERVINIPSSVR